MPEDFNFLYFYTGIKEIFLSNHSYLVLKTLALLYRHYKILSSEFKKEIEKLILYHLFQKLFLHWCSYVRKMFYFFLEFRISTGFKDMKAEVSVENL